jgi:hypothetical protein
MRMLSGASVGRSQRAQFKGSAGVELGRQGTTPTTTFDIKTVEGQSNDNMGVFNHSKKRLSNSTKLTRGDVGLLTFI